MSPCPLHRDRCKRVNKLLARQLRIILLIFCDHTREPALLPSIYIPVSATVSRRHLPSAVTSHQSSWRRSTGGFALHVASIYSLSETFAWPFSLSRYLWTFYFSVCRSFVLSVICTNVHSLLAASMNLSDPTISRVLSRDCCLLLVLITVLYLYFSSVSLNLCHVRLSHFNKDYAHCYCFC